LDVDGTDAEAVALRVFDEHGGGVKAHGLVVEDGRGERSQILHLEPGRGVGDERKAGGVRLGKSVECEGTNGLDNFVLRGGREAIGGHAAAQLHFQVLHALPGAAHTNGAAQLFGLGSAEVGDDHGHAQQLFLKKRDAKGALEDRLE
jgi:hypothetical protein